MYDYGFRIYNPRIGKFLSVDPLTRSYPWYTPYQFAGNQPIWAIDLDGLEEMVVIRWYDNNKFKGETKLFIENQYRIHPGGALYIDADWTDRSSLTNKLLQLNNQKNINYFFNPDGKTDQDKFKVGVYSSTIRNKLDNKALKGLKINHRNSTKGNHFTTYKTQSIYYTYNSDMLSDEAKEILHSKATILNENQDLRMDITGHASIENESGEDKNTDGIAKKRAVAAYSYLVNECGVDLSQLNVDANSDQEQRNSGSDNNDKYYRVDLDLYIPKNTVAYE